MSETPAYTEYHPRWYRTRLSTYWWLRRGPYLKFILRELSSVFVALWVVITLLQIRRVIQGPEAYAQLQAWLRRPPVILLNAVSLAFVLFHTVTWFKAAPQAMAVRVKGQRVPAFLVLAGNYLVWLAASGVVAYFILRS